MDDPCPAVTSVRCDSKFSTLIQLLRREAFLLIIESYAERMNPAARRNPQVCSCLFEVQCEMNASARRGSMWIRTALVHVRTVVALKTASRLRTSYNTCLV